MPRAPLRVYPNPFVFLDHEGLPAGTYPFDPEHAPGERRWVGAIVDRSLGPDGLPKTRRISSDGNPADPNNKGDVQATIKIKGVPTRVFVDRAPMKRIIWAFNVTEPTPIEDRPHYHHGLRATDPVIGYPALLCADEATAKRVGVPFVDPKEALAASAAAAIASWKAHYGEPPPIDTWPETLRAFVKDAPPAAKSTPAAAKSTPATAPATGGGASS